MITVTCPHCQDTLNVPEAYAGQRGTCKKCNGQIVVPLLTADPPPSGGAALPDDLASALDASFSRERPRPVIARTTLGDRLQPVLKPAGLALGILALVAVVVAGVAYLPTLGLGSGPSPETVTNSFLVAYNSGDINLCKPHLTEKSWQMMGAMPPGAIQKMDNYTVGTAVTTGDNSQVPVTVAQFGQTMTQDVLLRKESGAWRVHGIRVAPMPGMNMTIDFENPEAMVEEMKKMMEGLSPEMMQQMVEESMKQQMAR